MTLAPVPDVPEGRLSHDASGAAVQAQLACVVNVTVTLPPGMQGLNSIGLTEYWHATGSPPCVIANVRSATMIVALRSTGSLLAATVYDTCPLPGP